MVKANFFSVLGSCCFKHSNITKEDFSEKEIIFLAKNCEYLELICSERMVKIEGSSKYRYDNRIITFLKESNCFIGVTSSELISKIGEPSVLTDILIGYTFLKNNDSNKFIMISYGLKNGVVIGKAVLSGESVGGKTY